MTTMWCAVRGSVRYEARMAARGRVLWLSLLPLTALAVLLALSSPAVAGQVDPGGRIGTTVLVVNTFATAGLGVALAGRLSQHSRPGLTEILDTTPGGGTTRLAGVLAGALAVALVPVSAVVVLIGAVVSVQAGAGAPLAHAVLGVLTVLVPAALAMTTFAGLLGLLMPVVLARVVVVALWFWATQLSPSFVPVPTPTGTVLSPLGGYPAVVWLGARRIWANRQRDGLLSPPPDSGSAVLNVLLVLAFAAAFFFAARLVMVWRADGRGTQDGATR
jgi:ABC-2 type transport system permease protein